MNRKANHLEFIKALRNRLLEFAPTYYEDAPSSAEKMPYVVISGMRILDDAAGDTVFFDLEIWSDERKADASIEAEELVCTLRAALSESVLTAPGVLTAHLNFQNYNNITENEFDLAHKRLSFEARIFYY